MASCLSCGFAELVGGACGSGVSNPANIQCVVLANCKKDIQGHLKTYRVYGDYMLDCETKLILARAGKRMHICIYLAKCFVFSQDMTLHKVI